MSMHLLMFLNFFWGGDKCEFIIKNKSEERSFGKLGIGDY